MLIFTVHQNGAKMDTCIFCQNTIAHFYFSKESN